jgi:nicotinamidase-related amidase
MATTGVLFFDMVNYGARNPERAGGKQLEQWTQGLAKAVRIKEEARKRGMPLFYVKPDHRTDGRDFPPRIADGTYGAPRSDPEAYEWVPPGSYGGTWEAEIIDELAPAPEDTVLLKHRWSAFHQTALDLELRNAGVDTIALIGGGISVGIAATAYSARDHDIGIIFIQDATFSSDEETYQTLMHKVFPGFGLIRTADWFVEKLQAWRPG